MLKEKNVWDSSNTVKGVILNDSMSSQIGLQRETALKLSALTVTIHSSIRHTVLRRYVIQLHVQFVQV